MAWSSISDIFEFCWHGPKEVCLQLVNNKVLICSNPLFFPKAGIFFNLLRIFFQMRQKLFYFCFCFNNGVEKHWIHDVTCGRAVKKKRAWSDYRQKINHGVTMLKSRYLTRLQNFLNVLTLIILVSHGNVKPVSESEHMERNVSDSTVSHSTALSYLRRCLKKKCFIAAYFKLLPLFLS